MNGTAQLRVLLWECTVVTDMVERMAEWEPRVRGTGNRRD
jgi:hypothetical protein